MTRCRVDGCSSKIKARGLCGRHYQRLAAHGDPAITKMPTRGLSLHQRLHMHTDRNGPVPRAGMSRCWVWTGRLTACGYGVFQLDGTRMLAHRASYCLHVQDPGEKWVLHKCDTPRCLNPEHLFLGYAAENNADRHAKGRSAGPVGISAPSAKLTAKSVRAIRERYANGETQQSLADEFGVCRSNVGQIVRGVTWTHV